MRKTRLAALIAGACLAASGAQAGLTLSLDGSGGNLITADGLDWSQASLVAKDANFAAIGFAANADPATAALLGLSGFACTVCTFEVMTQARLTGYTPPGGSSGTPLPAGFTGEITMVTRFTEKVTFASFATPGALEFETTGDGWIEFYYSSAPNSKALTGANFNDGILIGQLTGVSFSDGVSAAAGEFGLRASGTGLPVTNLDQAGSDDYLKPGGGPTQQTLQGTGKSETILFGTTGVDLDTDFFKTLIAGFEIKFSNISTQLPNDSVDPTDCYNDTMRAGVGSAFATQCIDSHVLGPYSDQTADGGYIPDVGAVNVQNLDHPDFVAQTDFNSSVKGVPEPASIALLGLALGGLGFASRRKKLN